MRAVLDFFADIFLVGDGEVSSPKPRDLVDAYRAEVENFPGDHVFVLYDWTPEVQHALHAFKYSGARSVGVVMAHALAREFRSRLVGERTIVTWIPGRWFQYFVRGYNPSRILAGAFARAAEFPTFGLLVKTRATARQASLGRMGRLHNLDGAFVADSRRLAAIDGADVVLVDDVITTGSTFREAARALKAAGACTVSGVFVASSTEDISQGSHQKAPPAP